MSQTSPDPRQLFLDLGTAACFQLLHGGHDDHIAVATKQLEWNQRLYPHDDALYAQLELAGNHDMDVYQTQNGYAAGNRRGVDYVTSLTSFYVDLDVYNIPELKDIEAAELLDQVAQAFPWLPCPTMVTDSGRGYYLHWVFDKPVPKNKLARWQEAETILVNLLEPFGADLCVTDAARVLRVVGSVNQKNGEMVSAVAQTGAIVSFHKLASAIINTGLPMLYEQRQEQLSPGEVETGETRQATPAQKAQGLRVYQLHLDRMTDYHTLAALRGSPYMNDYRERLLFAYAVSGVYYWSNPYQAEQEVTLFCERHYLDALNYGKKKVGTVLERFRQQRAGVIHLWKGEKRDRRYHLTNRKIIDMLEITLDEQQHMRTLISDVERNRRRTARRRDEGVKPRDEYLQTANELQGRVCELRRRYWSFPDIAAELGISQAKAHRLAKSDEEKDGQ